MNQIKQVPFVPIMIAVGVGNFVAALSSTTVTIMLPVFMKEFTVDMVTVQWVITGYMLSSGMVAPLIGYLADKLSLRRTYLFAISGFTLMSLLVGLSSSIQGLLCFRILQGCFGGMVYPITMSLIYQMVEKEKQAFALSIWSVSGVLAPTFGPTVAGILTDLLSWQWVFFLNVPFALLAMIVVLRFVPFYCLEEMQEKTSFDWLGLITAVLGTYCLLFVFSNISRWGLGSSKTIGFLFFGTAATFLFVWHELHCKAPLLNLNVLRYSSFTWSLVILCSAQIVMNSSIVVMPLFLQDYLGYSTTASALILALGPLLIFLVVPFIGKYYHRLNGHYLLWGLMAIAAVAMWMHHQMNLTTSGMFVALAVMARDLGAGATSMPATNMGMADIPTKLINHASATSSWVRQCLVSLAIGLINTFLAVRSQVHLGQSGLITEQGQQLSYVAAMQELYLLMLVVVVVGFIAVKMLPVRQPETEGT